MIPGLLRFADSIDVGEEVVLMTTKGEAIAVGIAQMVSGPDVFSFFSSLPFCGVGGDRGAKY